MSNLSRLRKFIRRSPVSLIGQSPHFVKPGSRDFVFIATEPYRYHAAALEFGSKKTARAKFGPNIAAVKTH
jgi:hypothetical protein